MRHYFLIFLSFLLANSSGAQSLKAYERAGDDAFNKKDYSGAVQYYATVLKRDQDNADVLWKYAECARMFYAYPEAEKSYRKLVDRKKINKAYPLLNYRLGEVKKSQGDYEAAISYFEHFLAESPKGAEDFYEPAKNEISNCKIARQLVSEKPAVEVTHLGKEINSPFSDFAPIIVGDTLFFSSYRFDKKNDRHVPKAKLTKVMISAKNTRAREPGKGFPAADSAHIAHTAFSPDGHYVFFTVCKNINAGEIRCDLWMTVLDRRNRWLPAVKMPEPVNMKGYTTTHPSVAYDKDFEGPVLWFASDRPGGKGKLDLWYVPLDTVFFCPCNLPLPGKKIGKIPKFETPLNAESLNTVGNDATPFFLSKKNRLYFSSDDRPGLGGYDIYYTAKDSSGFAEPVNAGPGINTSFNDLYLFLRPDGQSGYLSSNRPGSFYLDEANKACCNDLYALKFPEEKVEKKEPPKDSASTVIVTKTPDPLPIPIPVPPQLRDFVGLPLYFDNDEPDKRTRETITKRSYDETVLEYLARQDLYRQEFAKGLRGPQHDEAENSIDDFFDNEVRRGYDRLTQLCDLLLSRLEKGERMEVLIKGFTSPRAQSDYNINLGKRRISSVRNQFETFADGALQEYLRSGQLKITETSFGETTARSGISDKLEDERNSVYHPDAARERRVEIVEIREK